MPPKYSICITHYNNRDTLEGSLRSILSQIDSTFEIVVVDNMSTDGSLEVLQRYEKEGAISLIVKRCSRGRGRQIALEHSIGDYILSNIDFDDQILTKLQFALAKYEQSCRSDLLRIDSVDSRSFWGGESVNVAPRTLLSSLGGWRDLQLGEDWELWRRAANAGRYKWTYYQLLALTNAHPERKTLVGRMRFRYVRYRDMMRCGREAFKKGEHLGVSQRVPLWTAKLLYRFYERYGDKSQNAFDPGNPAQFVDFGEGTPETRKSPADDQGVAPVSYQSGQNLEKFHWATPTV